MKLQYLKLYNKYRSLQPFEQSFPKHVLLKDRLDPIGLVGLNGNGKSNFLELIADIFFEVEVYFLQEKKIYIHESPNYFPYANNKTKDPICFDIRYKINIGSETHEVKILREKTTQKHPLIFVKKNNETSLFNEEEYTRVQTEDNRQFIPRVVAYTSGLNDLLTLPFIDLQDYYAQQVAKEAIHKPTYAKPIPSPNLSLLNYDTNAAIVVSNLLLASEEKCKVFKEVLRIERINSFRIVVRLNKLFGNSKVEITDELKDYIEKLQSCSYFFTIKKDEIKGDQYSFDFVVNDITKNLFNEKFESSQGLFEALTKLNLLNTLCIQRNYRKELRKKRKKGQLIKFPQTASLDKIFNIEKIELVLNNPNVRTEYEKISDGEHQFIHIIGSFLIFDEKNPQRDILYLLDEPDTHFNPLWRSTFFYQLESTLINKHIEFILTTHSPFILSDCHGYNVFKFDREGSNVQFKRLEKETYGATLENIINDVFPFIGKENEHFNNNISKQSYLDIEELYREIESIETLEQWTDQADNFFKRLRMLGDSADKTYVVKSYTEKEQSLRVPA